MVKIICTIGPATFDKVKELKAAGMDMARLNFAYAKPEQLDLLKGMPIMADVRKPELLKDVPKKFQYAAISFVTSAEDIKKARKLTKAKICAKIETREAMEKLDEIVEASDVVMIARGDLAKAVGIENIGIAQKKVEEACKAQKKPYIVATGLLESMIEDLEPRRAEVSDITNAISGGADFLLLANETAVGKHPVEAVKFLKKVIDAVKS